MLTVCNESLQSRLDEDGCWAWKKCALPTFVSGASGLCGGNLCWWRTELTAGRDDYLVPILCI